MGRKWRLVATALSFVVFGVGATALTVTVAPAIALFVRRPQRRREIARACIRSWFASFLSFMQLVRVVRLDVDADTRHALAAERGSVVVANHPSFLDVLVLLAHIEQSNCVVKSVIRRNPFLSWGVSLAGYIGNADPEALLSACETALSRNETLIIFPEATRSRPGEPIRLQRGAANIALRANATIRLVHFKCEPPLLAKGVPWYGVPERQPCLAMRVGGSVRARDFLVAGESRNAAAKRLTSLLQHELSQDNRFDERPGARAQAVAN
jgi:1-acyl-sn-glycerol-3-phosphate acyltransferase